MKIGLDLDGTVYLHPAFFADLISGMTLLGHTFFCISSHARSEWETSDVPRLMSLGIPTHLIDPSLMHHTRHGHLDIKGRACDLCDVVFDDDARLKNHTKTPVMCVL